MPDTEALNVPNLSPIQHGDDPISQTPEPNSLDEPIVDVEQREKENKKKKRKFIFLATIGTIFLLVLIAIPISVNIYKTYFLKVKPIVQEIPDENKTPQVPTVIDVSKRVLLNSDLLAVSVEYLQQATVSESSDPTNQLKKLEIVFDKQDGTDKVTEDNLKEGYIFRVSAYIPAQRTLEEVVKVKREGFTTKCPSTANFTDTQNILVNSIKGFTFEIQNCGADYKVSYVLKSGVVYEFAQIYKGDVGYRQVYRAATDDILSSLKFYPGKVDTGPLETYSNPSQRLSFQYPVTFKTDCCDIPPLVASGAKNLITLGDSATLVDRNNFDGFAVLMDGYGNGGTNAYLDKQRKILIDDYVVVKGEAPTLSETSIKVGNKDALLLKGYTWNGNNLIYVPLLNDNNSGRVLIISIKNISGDSFDAKMTEILKSFVFTENK